MKKKAPPRLTLKRETLHQLDPSILHGLVGGTASGENSCGPNSGLLCIGAVPTSICTNNRCI